MSKNQDCYKITAMPSNFSDDCIMHKTKFPKASAPISAYDYQRVRLLSEAQGVSMAKIIRTAVQWYLDDFSDQIPDVDIKELAA